MQKPHSTAIRKASNLPNQRPQLVTGIIELGSDVDAATAIPAGSLATLSFSPATSGTYHLIFYSDSTIVYINEIHGYGT